METGFLEQLHFLDGRKTEGIADVAGVRADRDTAAIGVSETTGGPFDDSQPVGTVPVGGMTVEFTDCSSATFIYTLADEGRAGVIGLTRLLRNIESLCEGTATAR